MTNRKIIHLTSVILLMFLMTFLLCSCQYAIDSDKAKQDTEDFFAALSVRDFEKATSFAHPAADINADKLLDLSYEIEASVGEKLADIKIVNYTGINISVYNSDYGGGAVEYDLDITVGDRECTANILIINNKEGYGISDFTINFSNSL